MMSTSAFRVFVESIIILTIDQVHALQVTIIQLVDIMPTPVLSESHLISGLRTYIVCLNVARIVATTFHGR